MLLVGENLPCLCAAKRRLRSNESPVPASSLPDQDRVWTARQACNPPRAAMFFSTTCAAVSVAGAALAESQGKEARETTRENSKVFRNIDWIAPRQFRGRRIVDALF